MEKMGEQKLWALSFLAIDEDDVFSYKLLLITTIKDMSNTDERIDAIVSRFAINPKHILDSIAVNIEDNGKVQSYLGHKIKDNPFLVPDWIIGANNEYHSANQKTDNHDDTFRPLPCGSNEQNERNI